MSFRQKMPAVRSSTPGENGHRRELVWISRDSSTVGWQVGEVVSFRNGRWRVVERAEDDGGTVTLTLAYPH